MVWTTILLALVALSGIDGKTPVSGNILNAEEIKYDEGLKDMESILMQIADMYNKRSNSLYAYKVTETIEVAKRIESPDLSEYDLTIKLSPTECKKNKDKFLKDDLKSCELNADHRRPQICTFVLRQNATHTFKIDMKGCK